MPGRAALVVVFGGQSAEPAASCVTAASLLAAVDPPRYEVVPIGITREGRWVVAEEAVAALEPGAKALPPQGPETAPQAIVAGERTVVFPLLHGPMGEDGTVQGLLELTGIPYVGTGVLGSALAMDKAKAKEVCEHAGLPGARLLAPPDGMIEDDLDDTVGKRLGLPVVVQPSD